MSSYLRAREPPWYQDGLPPIVNHADCSLLNPRAQGEQLISQLTWVAVLLFVKRVCPVHLVDESVSVFHAPL